MRWDALFGDLEAQLDAADAAELAGAVAEGTRYAVGALTLGQRLRAAAGDVVVIGLPAADPVRGRVVGVGPDWILVDDGGPEVLVPLAAVAWVQGLGRYTDVTDPGRVWERLGLRSALRGLARDRSVLRLVLAGGEVVVGTLDRVGADHVDVAVHPGDEVRRTAAVTAVRTVPLAAVLAVARRPD